MKSSDTKSCCAARRQTGRIAVSEQKLNDTLPGSTKGMALLKGGTFMMGSDSGAGFSEDGEGPIREVKLDPFYMDLTAVTNHDFAKFVTATGYKTDAERFGWSFVFYKLLAKKKVKNDLSSPKDTPWWKKVEGAYWKQPEGPGSKIETRLNHPVVHVSWHDVNTYCQWINKRLPTEAEWEYAARGGLEQSIYPWGNELKPDGKHRCNIWQGQFPDNNTKEDGYLGTAPVRYYKPNDYGLYNMVGNVWEWCHDWFSPTYPMLRIQNNPTGPGGGDAKVIRGGSYLCHESYCNRYRVAARSANTPDSSTGNIGFRCAKNVD